MDTRPSQEFHQALSDANQVRSALICTDQFSNSGLNQTARPMD